MSDTAAGLHEQALRAHAAGDRATAAALCSELLARDPGHAEAAFLLAAIAVEQGRPDPFPVSVPVLMRELGNSPRGVSEGGA